MNPATSDRNFTPTSTEFVSPPLGAIGVSDAWKIVHGQTPGTDVGVPVGVIVGVKVTVGVKVIVGVG